MNIHEVLEICIEDLTKSRPEAFAGLRVVIAGLGNTGSDVADALVGHASNIALSHHHGAVIVREPLLMSSPLLFFFFLTIQELTDP